MIVRCLTLCLLVGICSSQQPAPEGDEYVLNFDSPVYVCPDDASQAFVDTNKVEVKRHNETVSYMTGTFAFLQDMLDCTLVELVIEKESNGRTEVVVTHEICDICSEIGAESSYHKYLKYIGLPDKCPFVAAEYEILNFVTNSEDIPLNRANEGRYQVTLNFYKTTDCDCTKTDFIACLKLDFVIEPL